MPTTPEWISAVSVFALLMVAIVALFQDKIRYWLYHPVLNVSMDLNPPDCLKAKINGPDLANPIDAYYLRFRITNSGNKKAETVEVYASELSKKQADNTYRVESSFQPLNLIWAHYGGIFFDISPGMYRHCDLARIIDPSFRSNIPHEDLSWDNVQKDKTILSFEIASKPNIPCHLWPNGTYRLVVVVAAAANAEPITSTIEINITGSWSNNEQIMFRDGIGISIL